MWVNKYLIQPILSCYISLYKINLYKSLWLYYYFLPKLMKEATYSFPQIPNGPINYLIAYKI